MSAGIGRFPAERLLLLPGLMMGAIRAGTAQDLSRAYSPLAIGPLTLRNRFIKSATNEGMSPGGVPSRQYQQMRAFRCKAPGDTHALLDAATNPAAFFHGKPITLEDHQNSRWICDPLRLLDCCQESDGAVAMVITSVERARDLQQKPVIIKGAAQGIADGQQSMTSFYRDDITGLPEMGVVAREIYRQSGLGPDAIQTAVIYDHFTPFVMPQLEEFGFCDRGEAKEFIRAGHHARGGRLPINTHGGQLGEAYIHGMNGIAEGVRQVRGSSVNQVDNVENVLVTAGTGVPTSGLILGVA